LRLGGSALLLAFASALAGPAGAGTPLPDLIAYAANISLQLDQTVAEGDLVEGCARAATGVDLLRFDATTANVGSADLELGDPMCPDCATSPDAECGNPDFHCSPASGHDHPHFTNYARYELLDAEDAVVRTGGKFGFCLEDTTCSGTTPFYDCDYQGLQVGCEDLYPAYLGCQYIDVTGVPPGDYTLRVTADPENKIPEEDETNNASSYPVTIAGAEELDQLLPGASLLVKDGRRGPRLRLRARAKTPFTLPAPPLAPTVGGVTLEVVDPAGGTAALALPASGWKGLGRPPGSKGYRYRGTRADDCARARLTPRRVSAFCRTAIDLPVAGEVQLLLTAGGAKRYCARFGGTEKANSARRLERVKAPAAACP
jgi:hypothetical protein